jgi:AraC-like DNA-binding protein
MEGWAQRNVPHVQLSVKTFAKEKCSPGKTVGPVVRDVYSLHYILNGRGLYKTNGRTYTLKAGDCFLLIPEYAVYYEADQDDPWEYMWITFNGLKSDAYLQQAGLSPEHAAVYTSSPAIERYFLQLQEAAKSRTPELQATSLLCSILTELIDTAPDGRTPRSDKEHYINSAIEYIANHYSEDIAISGIAKHIGLDQSYLGVIFKQHTQMTLQQYLLAFRMERACYLMRNHDLSITDIARSVGYDNPLVFTRIFKKIKKLPPSSYRKSALQQPRSSM